MHWTVEAEKLDTTFYADFIVDRAAIIVHQAGIREQDAELMKVLKRLEVWVVKGNLRDVTQLTGVIKQVLGVSPTNAPAIERLSDQLVSRGWQVVVGLGKFVLLGVNRDQIGELGDQIKAEKLNLVRVLASETGPRKEALVIAESVQVAKPDRGGRDTGKSVIRLAKRDGGGWLVEDIDFESEESLKEEIDRFLKDFPDAQPVPEVDPDSVR
jgi:hypothetical protein